MTEKLVRPPLKITVKLDEGEHTVHMTYGLFSDMQRVCPDPGVVLEAGLTDPFARDYLIRRCMTESKKMISDEKELIAPEDMNLSDPDEIEKLLAWVTGHLLYFFARSAKGLADLGQKFKSQMEKTPVAPSKTGSES